MGVEKSDCLVRARARRLLQEDYEVMTRPSFLRRERLVHIYNLGGSHSWRGRG